MARREIEGMRSVVTGASSGIGRAIAVELVRQGARCVLLARSEDRLTKVVEECNALQGAGQVEIVAGDVTDAAVRKLAIEKSVVTYGGLDAVINNAGVGSFGRFSDSSPDRLRRIMEVNFFCCCRVDSRIASGAITRNESDCGERGFDLRSSGDPPDA